MRNKARQLSFDLRTHGGKRRGAGRKPKGEKPLVSHAARSRFGKPTPIHVTLKLRRDVPSLRSARRFAVVRQCFKAAKGLHGLRLIEFSVLSDHLHLLVEADTNVSLSRGVQGLAVRLARSLNHLLRRGGKLFADHFHSHVLLTPTEVARVIRYIQRNAEHHYREHGIDAFSSAAPSARSLLETATSWLLSVGWRRATAHEGRAYRETGQ